VRTAEARPVFERLFRTYGLPARIRSDNGVPFATTALARLSPLSVWWIRLGIRPELIEPGHPEQNGRHERMHKTLKADATPPRRRIAAHSNGASIRSAPPLGRSRSGAFTRRCSGSKTSTATWRARAAAPPPISKQCYPRPQTNLLPMSLTVHCRDISVLSAAAEPVETMSFLRCVRLVEA
jgi:hypothetical protein